MRNTPWSPADAGIPDDLPTMCNIYAFWLALYRTRHRFCIVGRSRYALLISSTDLTDIQPILYPPKPANWPCHFISTFQLAVMVMCLNGALNSTGWTVRVPCTSWAFHLQSVFRSPRETQTALGEGDLRPILGPKATQSLRHRSP